MAASEHVIQLTCHAKIWVTVSAGQSRTEEVAELCHTWRLTVFTPKILVTFFLVIVVFSWRFCSLSPRICTLPPLLQSSPLSWAALELISAYIHVPERHSGKIRGGGAAMRCAPPYFGHWSWFWARYDIFTAMTSFSGYFGMWWVRHKWL